MPLERLPAKPKEMTSSREEIELLLENLRSLRSAWQVLEPSRDESETDEIGATGRALFDHLSGIIRSNSDVSTDGLQSIDTLLQEFEQSIRHRATEIPLSELRSSIPSFQECDRKSLLDLLDVLIGEDSPVSRRFAERIGAIDYLITLLCTHGGSHPGAIDFDPPTLTPRLQRLCESAAANSNDGLTEIEAEFFIAANLESELLGGESHQASMRKRKAELNLNFFAPRILRAIVTYNTALLTRGSSEIAGDESWASLAENTPEPQEPCPSVFSSESLQRLGHAVRRRADGNSPGTTPEDRIAAALDFDCLNDNERNALCSPTISTRDDPLGTAILVGLLSRSSAVLSIELQEVGIPPDNISDVWIEELCEIFQDEINSNLSEDAYQVACALSDLKEKFLPRASRESRSTPSRCGEALRLDPASVPVPGAETQAESSAHRAEQLMQDALDYDRDDAGGRSHWDRIVFADFPWPRLIQRLFVAAALLALITMFVIRAGGPLDGLDDEQLVTFSPYLVDGKRDGAGTGASFVGTIDDRWTALPRRERGEVAREIVRRLREQGMNQVMIYDKENRVRVQAIGEQPTQVI